MLWVNPAVQGSAEGAHSLWGEFAYEAHLIICTMCDEEPPILLGNSTDAFLKWRSGEPSLLPLPSVPSLFHAVVPSLLCGFRLTISASSDSPNSLLPSALFSLLLLLYLCVSAAV